MRGQSRDGAPNVGLYEDVLEAFKEDKLFIEAQQESVFQDPDRHLLLREHDTAVAYSRNAIHRMQEVDTAPAQAAE